MVADEFAHLVSLTHNHERSWNDPALPDAEKNFFETNLKLARGKDVRAAYFVCFARIRHGLGEKYLSWQEVDKLIKKYANASFAPLHWIAYHFYGFTGVDEIENTNPFIDKKKAWSELEKAIELDDGHSMYEKAYFLNIMGASADKIKESVELLQKAICVNSKAACYMNGAWWINKNGAYEYNEEAALAFLERAINSSKDPYHRDDYIQKEALFELGKLYLTASQIERDEVQGVAKIREAARLGHIGASSWLSDYDTKNKVSPMSYFANTRAISDEPIVDFKVALRGLDDLVGLSDIKQALQALVYQEQAMALRRRKNLSVPVRSYHMVLTGNPGTGKTELAKRMGRIFKNLGIIDNEYVHIATRSILVGGYIGETAPKVRKAVEDAKGGILFIDEAYSLAPTSEKDYGHEAIQTLLYEMEENRGNVIVIVAGYHDPMQEFLRSNPGLASRFGYNFHLQNYSERELTDIFQTFCQKNDYVMDVKTGEMVSAYFKTALKKRSHRFANAREVRTLFEKAVEKQSRRIVESRLKSTKSLKEIKPSDLPLEQNFTDGNILYLASEKKQD